MCVKTSSSLATTPLVEAWGHGCGSCFFHSVFLDGKASTTIDYNLLSPDFFVEVPLKLLWAVAPTPPEKLNLNAQQLITVSRF
jgi:hypothetical protein